MDDKMDDKSCRKVAHKYYCEKCDYSTSKLYSWKKHIETKKHNGLQMMTKVAEKLPKSCYKCECGKKYKYRQGLHKHRFKCPYHNELEGECTLSKTNATGGVNVDKDNLILKLLEQNGKLIEALQKGGGGGGQSIDHGMGIHGNHNNQVQNNFNIQLYLNEDCKNAASIQDFAKKLKITMDDLSLLKNNEPKAITNIITKNLEDYTEIERPFHHHKKKWYVKDKQEGWDKQGQTGEKLVKNVKIGVSQKAGPTFVNSNPDWLTNEKKGKAYAETMSVAMKDVSDRNTNKILKSVKVECEVGKE